MDDIEHMRTALALARRGLGNVAPNPAVGCVIVKKGVVLGRGVTASGGRPHAEAAALSQAGGAAKDATAYVTLEPCAVEGPRGGPCAGALIKAGVKRVVIACIDPNPAVFGKGIEILKEAGIGVTLGVLENEAIGLNSGFFLKFKDQRPMVTLKMAVTADGMTVPKSGGKEWITGLAARRHVHLERSKHDAIAVGIGTVLKDNPMLTTRLAGFDHKAPRIILDSKMETPLDSPLVRSAREVPVWLFNTDEDPAKKAALEKAGVRLMGDGLNVKVLLEKLSSAGITRLFVEGGGMVMRAFAEQGYGDQFLLYRAPNVSWPGGTPLNFPEIQQKLGLELADSRVLGEDLLEIYTRKA